MGVHNVTGVLWPKHSCVKYLLKSLDLTRKIFSTTFILKVLVLCKSTKLLQNVDFFWQFGRGGIRYEFEILFSIRTIPFDRYPTTLYLDHAYSRTVLNEDVLLDADVLLDLLV